jgi:3-oxoacyl-[acyl-carrier-protein] synthase-3
MGVKIKDIGVYIPKNQVTNDVFIKYYNRQDVDIREFLDRAGRNKRYISDDPKENALTMGIEASKNVLDKLNMHSSEIDMIVFVSDTPQYLVPSNALLIHEALKCRSDISVFDMNANCVGGIVAVDMASKMMLVDKSLDNVLIVMSQQLQHYGDNIGIKPIFGDSACAVILEKTNDDKSYFIDSLSYTNPRFSKKMMFPSNGLSNVNGKLDSIWVDGYSQDGFHGAKEIIEDLLFRHGFKKSDVKRYFTSQMMKSCIDKLADDLCEDRNKFKYVGNTHGYCGVCSPFIALYKSIEDGEIDRGDLIILWSIGSGCSEKGLILKF